MLSSLLLLATAVPDPAFLGSNAWITVFVGCLIAGALVSILTVVEDGLDLIPAVGFVFVVCGGVFAVLLSVFPAGQTTTHYLSPMEVPAELTPYRLILKPRGAPEVTFRDAETLSRISHIAAVKVVTEHNAWGSPLTANIQVVPLFDGDPEVPAEMVAALRAREAGIPAPLTPQ